MARWLIFSLIVAVLTGVITIIWWWVGDLWADEEHQKFQPGQTDKNAGATVIRDFDRTDDTPE